MTMTPKRPSSAFSDDTTTTVSEEHLSPSSSSSISLGSASESDASTSSSPVLSDSSSGCEPARPKKCFPVRSWPAADEIALLEVAAEHQQKHGRLPSANDLAAALRGRLHAEDRFSADQIARQLRTLRNRYDRAVLRLSRGIIPVKDEDITIYKLSKVIWAGVAGTRKERKEKARAANAHKDPRGFSELAVLYPCLAAEVEAIDPGCGPEAARVLKRAFERIGDDTAARLEVKVKKQRVAEARANAELDRLKRVVAGELLRLIE